MHAQRTHNEVEVLAWERQELLVHNQPLGVHYKASRNQTEANGEATQQVVLTRALANAVVFVRISQQQFFYRDKRVSTPHDTEESHETR